jgi:hypothetical protein
MALAKVTEFVQAHRVPLAAVAAIIIAGVILSLYFFGVFTPDTGVQKTTDTLTKSGTNEHDHIKTAAPAAYALPASTGEPVSIFDDDYSGSLDGLDSPRRDSFSIVEADASSAGLNDRIEPIITSRNGGMLPTLDVRGDYDAPAFASDVCIWNQSSAQKSIKLGYVKDTERRKVTFT